METTGIIELIVIMVTIAGLFIWNRTESRADVRHMDAKLESNRALFFAVHEETKKLVEAIREEVKDFHKRLCDIESGKK